MRIGTDNALHDQFACQAIAEEMRTLVFDWHHRLSIFEPMSITSRINRTSENVEFPLDEDMFALCTLCDELRVNTHGAFNIASGTLRQTDCVHIDHAFTLNSENRTITKTDSRVMLDFGAIGKGYVLDVVRRELDAFGVKRAFIHGGTSSIIALGTDHHVLQLKNGYRIPLQNYAVGISEPYSQVKMCNGSSVGHLIDPVGNKPVDHSIEQIACVHARAAVADAYATACCVTPSLTRTLCYEPCTFIISTLDSTTVLDPLGLMQPPMKDFL